MLLAGTINYLGHAKFTFAIRTLTPRSLLRFMIVVLCNSAAASILVSLLTNSIGLLAANMVALVVVTASAFVGMKYFAMRD